MANEITDENNQNLSEEETKEINGNEDGEEDESQFDDPEGFVDTISDKDLLGDVLAKRPSPEDGIDSLIVVDNVPVVGQDRLDKLKNVIKKVFSKFGKIVNEFYPEENGKTKGYIFIEYANEKDAAQAVKIANGYKLDKHHIFIVNPFSSFDCMLDLEEDWSPPEKEPYEDKGNLHSWLLDADCNDQYSVIHGGGEKVDIYLNTSTEPVLLKERPGWTETYVTWSPQGTYLATFHKQGIALWGGDEFSRIGKFGHQGVQMIDFSPCERYIVTFSPLPDTPSDPQSIIIWDVRTGAKKRAFQCGNVARWPVFKWSHKGEYFARIRDEAISIYEIPSFGLLDKKSIKVPSISDFAWSPGDNVISYWLPEIKDTPARVTIMAVPGREELRVKNLFNVATCKMYWQNKGDYLCVVVDRYTKSKKALHYNMEIFHLREKQIPVDTLELKEAVSAFAWEPQGDTFAIIHGESPKISASFYRCQKGGHTTLLKTFEKKQVNNIFWAPRGQFCVLAGLRGMNGTMEFYDLNEVALMNVGEHFTATDVEWDPSGRYVSTSVSWWAQKVDNGYNIWSFQGKLLQRHSINQFCQMLWRPRPQTLLSDDQVTKIKSEIKKYQKMFENKDRMSQKKASKELIEKRRSMMREFLEYRDRKKREFQEQEDQRHELRKGFEDLQEEVDDFEEESVEFFIKEEQSIVE
ncbi:Eukaryotic translation initiation factor 3 subunit B [Paramuricea clavata]|uniref:Eukaryotic translation initiation factor 3 subunit B n=1 Tax=Paramuricea clavata TaxID=317549 RepID=A0A7D9DQQ1_PARCT|nr:Eukaryotic translation initiation factor 3 subunit B [Paramuricea clavata]